MRLPADAVIVTAVPVGVRFALDLLEPPPWTVAMEATIVSGWIYGHLLPHAAQIKVAHP